MWCPPYLYIQLSLFWVPLPCFGDLLLGFVLRFCVFGSLFLLNYLDLVNLHTLMPVLFEICMKISCRSMSEKRNSDEFAFLGSGLVWWVTCGASCCLASDLGVVFKFGFPFPLVLIVFCLCILRWVGRSHGFFCLLRLCLSRLVFFLLPQVYCCCSVAEVVPRHLIEEVEDRWHNNLPGVCLFFFLSQFVVFLKSGR